MTPPSLTRTRLLILLPMLALLAACGNGNPVSRLVPLGSNSADLAAMYGPLPDGEFTIPAIPAKWLSERNKRQMVEYWTAEAPGTIVVDPYARFLYLVMEDNEAMRYGIAVGEEGRGFSGTGTIPFTREWPRWTPTDNMLDRDPELYGPVADGMEGGLLNPLGARALYLFQNGRDTLYRIHGTSSPWSIGRATSAGCIRLYNQDIVDLHGRIPESGTRVVVLSRSESGQGTRPPRVAGAGAARG